MFRGRQGSSPAWEWGGGRLGGERRIGFVTMVRGRLGQEGGTGVESVGIFFKKNTLEPTLIY